MKRDILDIEDVKLLVDFFYEKVKEDADLAPVLNEKIGNSWSLHLEKMYAFWQTILLEEHTYFGSPFPPHAHLPIGKEHFNKWLKLFFLTVQENFKGEKADEAIMRAEKMAEMFQYKIEYLKSNKNSKYI